MPVDNPAHHVGLASGPTSQRGHTACREGGAVVINAVVIESVDSRENGQNQ